METEGLNFQSMNLPKERKNQIEEYLDFYGGPGIQHIAIATDDIIKTIGQLKAEVEVLSAPPHT
jgi:4-hydroxyphenylpyruvate dioxygenase